MFGIGFSNFICWPMNFTLVSVFFNKQNSNNRTDGFLLGLWSTSWEFGNIVGLGLCNFILHQFHLRWEIGIFVINIAYVISGFFTFYKLKNPSEIISDSEHTSI